MEDLKNVRPEDRKIEESPELILKLVDLIFFGVEDNTPPS